MKPGIKVQHRALDQGRVLSFSQERLWYLDQVSPGNAVYNTPLFLRLHGRLEPELLHRALEAVVERHEVLRTAFLTLGGQPVPVVPKKRSIELRQEDLRSLARETRKERGTALIEEDAAKPFHLARDPMIRALLVRVGDDEYLFLCVIHHIVFEGGSVAIFFRDLAAFYNSYVTGKTPDLPELEADYYDFCAWQRASLDNDRLAVLEAFWKKQLTGAPNVDLPLDFSRPAVHTMRGAKLYFEFPPSLRGNVEEFFSRNHTTSYRSLGAAFLVLLHCYTGLEDICLGTPCTPRCRGIEDLIGFFVNTVVLRVQLDEELTYRELIRKVDVALHSAIAHSDLPFHKILDAVQPARDPSRPPLFQVNFRAPQQPYPQLRLLGVDASPLQVLDNGTAKFDLALEVGEFVNGATYFEYCSDLFRRETIAQMARDFEQLLSELIASPDRSLREITAMGRLKQRIQPQRLSAKWQGKAIRNGLTDAMVGN